MAEEGMEEQIEKILTNDAAISAMLGWCVFGPSFAVQCIIDKSMINITGDVSSNDGLVLNAFLSSLVIAVGVGIVCAMILKAAQIEWNKNKQSPENPVNIELDKQSLIEMTDTHSTNHV